MTTIAYKNGTVAFDSLVTDASGMRVGYFCKAKRIGDYLAAGCGDPEFVQEMFDWIMAGFVEDCKPKSKSSDSEVIVIHKDSPNAVTSYSKTLIPMQYKPLMKGCGMSIGSGSDIAIGAMAYGASATEAVRIARKFDTSTGGRIHSVSFNRRKSGKEKASSRRKNINT